VVIGLGSVTAPTREVGPTAAGRPTLWFKLPDGLAATAPPEARDLARDGVRLLVAAPAHIEHARFSDLAEHLSPGDLLVFNTSATVPAAIDAKRVGGRSVVVHVATPTIKGPWVVELRHPDGSGPTRDGAVGEQLTLAGGLELTLGVPHPDPSDSAPRFWLATAGADLLAHLSRWGRPITYEYVRERWPLGDYQTVFGRQPGSAEMPSAGRPFTAERVTELVTRGIMLAPVTLHTGVSSPDAGEPPQPERFHVPVATARLVNHARSHGGRVVAVGTTVTRAIETMAGPDGRVYSGRGVTDLVLGPDRPARVVTGLVTGWHAPEASHLQLLEAVSGVPLVRRAYAAALDAGYAWHEFGDSALFLPAR
jgi:S-adenosylmethionine:tRNA ribosyltransferase-isomerase